MTNEIVITRVIDAPRERVFKAFTDPSIVQWWGPNGFTTTTHERNVKVGGVWRYTMHGPDGKDYENIIEYVEIKKPELLRYRHGESDVHINGFNSSITFEEEGEKTKVTLHLVLPTKEERDRVVKFGAIEGGNQTLARLDRHLGGHMTRDIIITRTFDAPAALVYKAWTTPEHIKKWWGPHPFTCPVAKIDLRVGGRYHYLMRDPQGNDAWSGGEFKEIVPNKRLVVTDYFADEHGHKISPKTFGFDNFPEESTVVVTFEEHHGKTTLKIHYAPETQAAYDAMLKTGMVEGWNSSLDKFQELVENL